MPFNLPLTLQNSLSIGLKDFIKSIKLLISLLLMNLSPLLKDLITLSKAELSQCSKLLLPKTAMLIRLILDTKHLLQNLRSKNTMKEKESKETEETTEEVAEVAKEVVVTSEEEEVEIEEVEEEEEAVNEVASEVVLKMTAVKVEIEGHKPEKAKRTYNSYQEKEDHVETTKMVHIVVVITIELMDKDKVDNTITIPEVLTISKEAAIITKEEITKKERNIQLIMKVIMMVKDQERVVMTTMLLQEVETKKEEVEMGKEEDLEVGREELIEVIEEVEEEKGVLTEETEEHIEAEIEVEKGEQEETIEVLEEESKNEFTK
jgi:hypothetical protein